MSTPMDDLYDDEWVEGQPCQNCPKCGLHYDDIDFDYQICRQCGWDEEEKKYGQRREPTEADFIAGEADILTGRWN